MNRRISIVVPVYNKEPYLAECIKSLQRQTYSDIEIILIDDGSTDDSAEICKKFCEEDARIRYIWQENAGQNAARKAGVDAASGSWVIFVDADDVVTPTMCSLLMSNMEATGADFVHSAHQLMENDGRLGIIVNERPGIYTGRKIIETFYFEQGSLHFRPQGRKSPSTSLCATLYPIQTIHDAMQRFDMCIRLSEDTACLLSMLARAKRVSYIPDVTYYYRRVENSVSFTHKFGFLPQIQRFSQYVMKSFREAGLPEEDNHIIDGMALSLLLYNGLEYFDDYPGIFPFTPKRPVGRIALYGAGMMGGEVYVKERERLSFVGWYDRMYEHYRAQGFDVRNPLEMDNEQIDTILIGIFRATTAKDVTDELKQRFPAKKIYGFSDEIINSDYTKKKLADLRKV